ncbi:MAG TPA: GAF domain-containing protein, partial [Pseudolabrys sp.]|nr:GAF domain-containing protein [Pseudolabrys sp.]
MRRRDKAAKTQRHKKLKRRSAAKAARRRKASTVDATERIALLSRERDVARDQQTTTAEILRVIANSPTNVQPVFDAIAQSALRLFAGQSATVTRVAGDMIHLAALTAGSEAGIKSVQSSFPSPLSSSGIHSRVARSGTPAFRTDIETDPDVRPGVKETARARGYRSILVVPMLRDGVSIGTIGVTRRDPTQFTASQFDLLRTFAAQAVIAIENTRLLNELRESLQQQTATSEVLSVISSSPGELQPVFATMLAKAIELCEASFGAMWLVDGDGYRTAALHGDLPEAYVEQWRRGTLHRPKAVVPMVRAIRSRKPVHVTDMLKDKAYMERDPLAVSVVKIAGIRTLLTVPMLKEGEAIGVVTIYRKEVHAFSDKQIELVSNFAKQAVIAIENTRLLSELRMYALGVKQTLHPSRALTEVATMPWPEPREKAMRRRDKAAKTQRHKKLKRRSAAKAAR